MSEKVLIQTPIQLDNGISLQFPTEHVELSKEDLDRLTGVIHTLDALRPRDPNSTQLKALSES